MSDETHCSSILVNDYRVFTFWVVAYGGSTELIKQDTELIRA